MNVICPVKVNTEYKVDYSRKYTLENNTKLLKKDNRNISFTGSGNKLIGNLGSFFSNTKIGKHFAVKKLENSKSEQEKQAVLEFKKLYKEVKKLDKKHRFRTCFNYMAKLGAAGAAVGAFGNSIKTAAPAFIDLANYGDVAVFLKTCINSFGIDFKSAAIGGGIGTVIGKYIAGEKNAALKLKIMNHKQLNSLKDFFKEELNVKTKLSSIEKLDNSEIKNIE